MSEYTHYFAVEREVVSEIKEKLESAALTALVDDFSINKPENTYTWVVIEAPRKTGCTTPGDYSTFTVLFDPWETIKALFPKALRFFVEENNMGWEIDCSQLGKEEFHLSLNPDQPSFPETDQKTLSEFFGIPFDTLADTLKPDSAYEFCKRIGLPYLEMEDQDHLDSVIPSEKVIFASEMRG